MELFLLREHFLGRSVKSNQVRLGYGSPDYLLDGIGLKLKTGRHVVYAGATLCLNDVGWHRGRSRTWSSEVDVMLEDG